MSETDSEELSQNIEISVEKKDEDIINVTDKDVTNDLEDKNKTDNSANYSEWNGLIDRSNSRYHIHTKSTTLWNTINHIFNLSLIIASSIITADGIGDIFNKDVLVILGLIMMVLSSINTFLDPSSKYTRHRDISKKYRLIYHQTRRCDNFMRFLELQKQFEDTEQEAPDIPIFFNQKRVRVLFMNPNLQNDFNNYYRYQNEPQAVVVNTYAAKMDS